MKLSLARGGGVAGLRKPPLELDTHELPAAASEHLRRLVAEANLGGPSTSLDEATLEAHRDSLGYTLTVTDDHGRTTAVDFAHAAASPALRALVAELRKLAGHAS